MLLLIGVGLFLLAAVVGSIAFVGESAERAGVRKSLAHIERRYEDAFDSANERPFSERVIAPALGRLGTLGTALTPSGGVTRLQRHLDYLGNPPGWPVDRVVSAKGVGLIIGSLAGLAFGLTIGGLTAILLSGAAGAVVGFLGPDLMIYNNGVKRQQELRLSLPDVLDTLTISVEAGQGFDAALMQVARNGRGPMVGEMARVLQEMRIGKARTEALRAMAARTTVAELKGFASAVVQASDLGVPIAKVLREQSKEMRLRRRQRAEEQAQKVPIKILFPTLFCLFPALFVVILGPGVLSIISSFSG